MSHVLNETLKNMHDALVGHEELKSKVTGVYSHVPAQATFPYIVLAPHQMEDCSSKTHHGMRATIDVRLMTRDSLPKSLRSLEVITRLFQEPHWGLRFEKACLESKDANTSVWTRRYKMLADM